MNLKGKPFYLQDEDIAWIGHTISEMTIEEKVAQLFCVNSRAGDAAELERILQGCKAMPGGVMYRPMPAEKGREFTKLLAEKAKIPMLIAANLEKGGNGIVDEGTMMASPLEVAATDQEENAKNLAVICSREGSAVGANWAFAPIIDIDYNFRNPITNTRTFGSEPERVQRMGLAYLVEVQKQGLAACIKHFPGDGLDERDQHLVTSINDFSIEEWDNTYGKIYQSCIDAGALTCMIGHIMQPAYTRKFSPGIRDEEILPASLSKELMTGLLRGQLGFEGLIVTDATTMAGFTIPMPREKAVPLSIAAGADMFLFSKNMQEDIEFMHKGVKEGVISAERLQEALTRILALKAALKLRQKKELPTIEETISILSSNEHKAWAAKCADEGITLVKEEPGVLPISPSKGNRVLLFPIESEQGFAYSVKVGVCEDFKRRLEKEGFNVEVFEAGKGEEGRLAPTSDYIGKYDYIFYFANMATKSNQTCVRIEWAMPMGANCCHYVSSIPTIFISVENPYHLLDIPRVRTFINCYNSNDFVMEALLDKLMGRSEFKGINPVDPFCGKWDARLKY